MIRRILSYIRAVPYRSQLGKGMDDIRIGLNIYESGPTLKAYVKHQVRIHGWFKGVVMVPALWFADLVLGKYKVKSIPPNPWHKGLAAFDRAFDEALKKWNYLFRPNTGKHDQEPDKVVIGDRYMGMRASKTLMALKSYYLTIMMNDTAYFEFHNCLMLELYQELHKIYGTDPSHIFYTSKVINSNRYFIIQTALHDAHVREVALGTQAIKAKD